MTDIMQTEILPIIRAIARGDRDTFEKLSVEFQNPDHKKVNAVERG